MYQEAPPYLSIRAYKHVVERCLFCHLKPFSRGAVRGNSIFGCFPRVACVDASHSPCTRRPGASYGAKRAFRVPFDALGWRFFVPGTSAPPDAFANVQVTAVRSYRPAEKSVRDARNRHPRASSRTREGPNAPNDVLGWLARAGETSRGDGACVMLLEAFLSVA